MLVSDWLRLPWLMVDCWFSLPLGQWPDQSWLFLPSLQRLADCLKMSWRWGSVSMMMSSCVAYVSPHLLWRTSVLSSLLLPLSLVAKNREITFDLDCNRLILTVRKQFNAYRLILLISYSGLKTSFPFARDDAYTHIYSEIINALEFAEVFLEFGINRLILHLCVFQESPEFLQSIQLTYINPPKTSACRVKKQHHMTK